MMKNKMECNLRQKNVCLHIVFVCLGNICRSPLAEVIVRTRATERGLAERFIFSSAGTGDWHLGYGADRRSYRIAMQSKLDLSKHRAQQIRADNYRHWDRFVAMDKNNWRDMVAMGVPKAQMIMLRQFEASSTKTIATTINDVPDPYYGHGDDGFAIVYQILTDNADAVLDWLLT